MSGKEVRFGAADSGARSIPVPAYTTERFTPQIEDPAKIAQEALSEYLAADTPRTRLLKALSPIGPAMTDFNNQVMVYAREASTALELVQAVKVVRGKLDAIAAQVIADHEQEVLDV
jgi:phosphopantetheine adenylyltransferase